MYDARDDMGEFHGTTINFAEEYHAARKLMGTKGTNLDDLHYHVGLLYVNTPDKWVDPYICLMEEITMRQNMMARLPH